jgi:diguanylate cyclase (GGDEF)-like protein/PAS domain S-box-containing protein
MVMIWFTGWMALLTIASYAAPAWHLVFWPAIGLSGAAAIVVGIVRHRPRHKGPWVLVALAVVAFAVGDGYYEVLNDVLHVPNPFPCLADIFYLAMYPLIAAGLLLFIRYRNGRGDRGSLLDALTLTAGVGLLCWISLIVPYVRDHELSLIEKAVSIAYPLGDVLIIATLARLLAGGGIRTFAVSLLGVGTAGLLVSDVLYGLIQLDGGWHYGTPVDLGWVVFYTAWGAAALHPSMSRLTEPVPAPVHEVSLKRLGLLTAASLIAPVVLLVEATTGEADMVSDAPVIAVSSAVMFLLVLSRLSGVVARHRQAVSRERGLRMAGAALVSAADVSEVRTAVRRAVASLLPADAPHVVSLLVNDSTNLGIRHADPVERWPAPVHQLRATLVETADIDPGVAAELPGFRSALFLPLALDDRPAGNPMVGLLLVGADPRALQPLQAPLEVLASQAALALERIGLTNEVNRRNSEEYFRTLVHSTADVILIVNDAGRVRYASPSAATVFGLNTVGIPLRRLVHSGDRAAATQLLRDARDGRASTVPRGPVPAPAQAAEWRVLRGDGGYVQVEVSCRDLSDDPAVRGLILTLRDLTERRQLERELTHRAFHDSLTGMANRLLFTDRVEHAVNRAARDGGVVGVLFIDLDDFKVVNDTMGHALGDELLIAVAERISQTLRPVDTPARLGGDEFAVLIEDAHDAGEVEELAARLVGALSAPFPLGLDLVNAPVSVGVATTADTTGAQDLLRQADLALYMAKTDGKGRWRRYQAMLHTAVLQRLEMRAALDQAVADNAFVLHYQPIVDLPTGNLVGLEALVRWQHPTLGLIGPNEFIELAEESGLIVPIGNWVLEQATAMAVAWRRRPGAVLDYVSVNVSARQFRSPGFVDHVLGVLNRAELEPGALLLEITESLLLRDDEQVWADLTELRRIGVKIAIDDFGTGYSSLSYLRQFPVDTLKIDKSFIDDMIGSEQQRAVVDAIVRLAETLQLTVVAEGIEDAVQRDLLAGMGCPLGQGFLFSRPLPAADVDPWLTPQRVAA